MPRKIRLLDLPPGSTFRLPETSIECAELLYANECRARVRIHRGSQTVTMTDRHGNERSFVAQRNKDTDWAPTVLVEPISVATPESKGTHVMATAKKTTAKKSDTKKAATKKVRTKKGDLSPLAADVEAAASTEAPAKEARAKKAPAETADGKLSGLDAAAKVLAEAAGPLSAKELVAEMEAKGYWKSPGGKTPHATIYSAMLREINVKGKDARFKKTDRGKFAAAN